MASSLPPSAPDGQSPTPFDWTRLHYGICPRCGWEKFIGHGPLCTDCYLTGDEA